MAGEYPEKHRPPRRRRWKKSSRCFVRGLLCCSCLCGDKEQEQEEKINGGPLHPHGDQRGSGEGEAVQITLEDLGIVNTSFSLFDEDLLTPRKSVARSSSSLSASKMKKNPVNLVSSLPLQPQSVTSSNADKDEEEGALLFGSGTDSTPASGYLLTPPAINLIPPTPSDVEDDDQFFDNNSEESVAHTSGGEGSVIAGDQETYEEKTRTAEELRGDCMVADCKPHNATEAEPDEGLNDETEEQREAVAIKKGNNEKEKPKLLRSVYQVAPLPKYPQKNDWANSDRSHSDMLKAELSLLPHSKMDTFTHQRPPLTRSLSLGETMTRSAAFHGLTQTPQKEAGSPRRRITVASYMPDSKDQNGNFPEKDANQQVSKPLRDLNTEEVCQWFTSIGLEKCLPFIREAKLSGADIASVDVETLEVLQIGTLEDREQLLSAIYNELHPPSAAFQRVESVLESSRSNNVDTFTTTMPKSKSSPHVSCLSMNRRSLKLRNNGQNYSTQRNTQLIEITINASERIVHLRTPKETTVGKVMDSCIKMLGVTEDKSLFTLKEKQGSTEELQPDQQIAALLTSSTAENRQLELHLCKRSKQTNSNGCNENGNMNKNIQANQAVKEERIKELNQQVDSLQNVVLQIQELHHGLVAFCSELKNTHGDVSVEQLGSAELKEKLELVNSQLNDKRQTLQSLRDSINNFAAHKKKQLEVRLLEKMKLNCQVFKEEISIVHLNRQAAHLQNTLQECYVKEKAEKKTLAIGSLSQLLSPQSPAMLLVVEENQNSDGHYSFTCGHREGSGLVVTEVDDSHLCVDDRLVEVNGVPVVNSTLEELSDLLLTGPSAQIVVLRQPPPTLTPPPLPQGSVSPDLTQTVGPERHKEPTETVPQRKVMAI